MPMPTRINLGPTNFATFGQLGLTQLDLGQLDLGLSLHRSTSIKLTKLDLNAGQQILACALAHSTKYGPKITQFNSTWVGLTLLDLGQGGLYSTDA